jgi:hypothetical protein
MDAYDTGKMNQGSNSYSAAPSHAAPITNNTHSMKHQSVSMNQVQNSMHNLHVETFSKSETSTALVSPTEVSAMDAAMKKLVNMDDVSQPVFKSYSRNSKMSEWEGKENLPLSSLKSSSLKQQKAPVMRSYETYNQQQQQQPDALVVYGEQHAQQQGPPPLSFSYRY